MDDRHGRAGDDNRRQAGSCYERQDADLQLCERGGEHVRLQARHWSLRGLRLSHDLSAAPRRRAQVLRQGDRRSRQHGPGGKPHLDDRRDGADDDHRCQAGSSDERQDADFHLHKRARKHVCLQARHRKLRRLQLSDRLSAASRRLAYVRRQGHRRRRQHRPRGKPHLDDRHNRTSGSGHHRQADQPEQEQFA